MIIRPAKPADSASMMVIYNEAIIDEVHANCDTLQTDVRRFAASYFAEAQRYGVYVSESPEGELIGWAALKKFSAFPHSRDIAEVAVYISRRWRAMGLGIRLLRRLQDHARIAEFHSLVAIILEHNRSSVRGSEHCGFRTCVTLPSAAHLSNQYEDIIWMQYSLLPSA